MRCGIITWQLGFCVAKYSGSMVITQSYRVTVTFSMFSVILVLCLVQGSIIGQNSKEGPSSPSPY